MTIINGTNANDRLVGTNLSDQISALGGDDIIIASDGSDHIDGGDGTDTVDYSGYRTASGNGGIFAQLNNLDNNVAKPGLIASMDYISDTLLNIENVTGSAGSDYLVGNLQKNVLDGGAGRDLIIGVALGTSPGGGDRLFGGADQDVMFGGIGDFIDGGADLDTAFLDFRKASSGITADFSTLLAGGTVTIGKTQVVNIETLFELRGSNYADTITVGDVAGPSGYGNYDIIPLPNVANPLSTVFIAGGIYGGGGNDTLTGGNFQNLLDGGIGNDVVSGLGGDDWLIGGNGADRIFGGDGNDVLISGVGVFANAATAYSLNQLFGGAITVQDDSAGDVLDGGSGDDRLFASLGDRVIGGDGNDQLMLTFGGTAVAIDAKTSIATTEVTSVEVFTILLSTSDDLFDMTNAGLASLPYATINASEGNDHVVANNSGMTLVGGLGADTLIGGSGADVLLGGRGSNVLIGGGGNDILVGDYLQTLDYDGTSGRTGDIIDGGDGNDTVSYSDKYYWTLGDEYRFYRVTDDGVTVDLSVSASQNTGGGSYDTLISIENVVGTRFDDVISGNDEANVLDGGVQGNDRIYARGGDDLIIANLVGSETFDGGEGNDTVTFNNTFGGVAIDLMGAATPPGYGLSGRTFLISNVENLVGTPFDDYLAGDLVNFNRLSGGGGNDLLVARGGDYLAGEYGNDRLVASAKSDTLDGGDGIDTADFSLNGAMTADLRSGIAIQGGQQDHLIGIENVIGSKSADTVRGDDGANIIDGLSGNDALYGMGGDDTLIGGAGHDRLVGGIGRDLLTGGAGNDLFVFQSVADSPAVVEASGGGRDVILDFSRSDGDRISLTAIDANILKSGNQAFTLLGYSDSHAFTGKAGELLLIYDAIAGHTTVKGDIDGNGAADFAFDVMGTMPLIAADFQF